MTERAPRQTAVQWSAIIKEFDRSGLSAGDFCAQRGYAPSTFDRWRRRFSAPSPNPVAYAEQPIPSAFIEALPDGGPSIKIHVGEQVVVECPMTFGVDSIASLVRTLGHHDR